MGEVQIRVGGGAVDVAAAAWDALDHGRSPFTRHGFLAALETSGSVGPGTGWQPLFVTAWRGQGLVGGAPLYAKTHSYGEYIFDWGWAEAAQRAGLPYYPKGVVAVPFTPATGRRLLVAPGEDALRRPLAEALKAAATSLGLSSMHALCVEPEDQAALTEAGFLPRSTLQYHWRDEGFGDWEGFLAALRSKRRREIRRERRLVQDAGVALSMLRGDEAGPEVWDAVWRFYLDTSSRKWGQPYLTRGFFDAIAQRFGDRARIGVARRDGRVIATALHFEGDGAMYGRYWGCEEPLPALHFELCYHQAIEHCLANGIGLYEAGAQGEHKIARGFRPVAVGSAHWLRHPGLHDAVARFVEAEDAEHRAIIEAIDDRGPYRDDG